MGGICDGIACGLQYSESANTTSRPSQDPVGAQRNSDTPRQSNHLVDTFRRLALAVAIERYAS